MTYSWVTEVFGYTGGIVLSICTIPQIIQIFKTKCAKDISIWFAVLYSLGLSLTFVYMVLIGALAGIITMAFETILSFVVIGSKLYFD
jgi:MtN3 and saliva related transmembrane protein